MATSAITNTIKDPSGTAVAGVVVTATLQPSAGFRISDSTEVAQSVSTTTDGSGVWTLNLERTANINPANSWYLIVEAVPESAGGSNTWAIQVTANSTVAAALVAAIPPSDATQALTITSGDARYVTTIANSTQTILSMKTVGVGTPNPLSAFAAAPRWLEVEDGSAATPVLTAGPVARISRTGSYVGTTGGGTKLTNEKNAALVLLSTEQGADATGTDMQANALFCYATATTAGPWDAVGINSVGRSQDGNTRRGTGAYFEGRKDNSTGLVGGLEARANNADPNNTATDGTYNTSGGCNVFGVLVSSQAAGTANPKLGVGIQLITADNVGKFGVGLGFASGSTVDVDVQSDSQATTSHLIAGTHTNALLTSAAAGLVGLGLTAPLAARAHIDGVSALTPTGVPSDAIVFASDSQGMTANRGASLGLGGWTDLAQTTMRSFGHVSGKKSNATDANTTGYLRLSAHLNAVGLVEYLRIDGSAGITVPRNASAPASGAIAIAGLTGAVAASRYAGATVSGAPVSGTFGVGDWVVAQNGAIFVCTVAGTPGTWVNIGSGGGFISPTMARVAANASTLSSGAGTTLAFLVDYDPATMFSAGHFTYPTTGKWAVAAYMRTATAASGSGSLEIFQNGANIAGDSNPLSSTINNEFVVYTEQIFTAGDTTSVVAFQDSGGNLAIARATFETHFVGA